jgi:hypothetical protein
VAARIAVEINPLWQAADKHKATLDKSAANYVRPMIGLIDYLVDSTSHFSQFTIVIHNEIVVLVFVCLVFVALATNIVALSIVA